MSKTSLTMVKKFWLIIANAFLWAAAGINIARIGIQCAISEGSKVWLWCIPVFAAFGAMFFRVIAKNAKRIHAMEGEKAPLYKFLTLKSYLLIAFMMTMGITLRSFESVPDSFFAYFYTGLGSALTLAGLTSLLHLRK